MVFIENPSGGGVLSGGLGRAGGEGPGRCLRGIWGGGGAKYFFVGAEIPTKLNSELPFHQNFIQSVNHFSGVNVHMQLQFRNLARIICLYSYSSFLSVDYFNIQVVRLQAPAHPSPSSSLFSCPRKKSAERTKSLEKNSTVGCRATKSLEKTALVQSEQNPGKNSTFGCTANKLPEKTAF